MERSLLRRHLHCIFNRRRPLTYDRHSRLKRRLIAHHGGLRLSFLHFNRFVFALSAASAAQLDCAVDRFK